MKFIIVYGPPGIGKESIGRELAIRNGWALFQQHLAFDISCAVIGFGNTGFEEYQREVCLDAFNTLVTRGVPGIVFTFCYVYPGSNYFMDGLFDFLSENDVDANFVRISANLDEHIRRVKSEDRKNTNKIQSKRKLQEYLERFDFSVEIPGVQIFNLDSTKLSPVESAIEIEKLVNT